MTDIQTVIDFVLFCYENNTSFSPIGFLTQEEQEIYIVNWIMKHDLIIATNILEALVVNPPSELKGIQSYDPSEDSPTKPLFRCLTIYFIRFQKFLLSGQIRIQKS